MKHFCHWLKMGYICGSKTYAYPLKEDSRAACPQRHRQNLARVQVYMDRRGPYPRRESLCPGP